MNNQGKKDAITGIVILLVSILVLVAIPSQIKDVGNNAVGPRTLPYFAAILLMVCSILLIIKGLIKTKRASVTASSAEESTPTEQKSEVTAKPTKKPLSGPVYALLFFALLIVYVILMRPVGYIISSLVFLPIMLYFLHVRKWPLYLVVIPIVLAVYGVFSMMLYVQLP